jgi:hypothetical protein
MDGCEDVAGGIAARAAKRLVNDARAALTFEATGKVDGVGFNEGFIIEDGAGISDDDFILLETVLGST